MKPLVAFFSATGNTEYVAKTISELLNCDLYEIVADPLYTKDDLDWNEKRSRSSKEMNDPHCRPSIAYPLENAAEYDTIYLGFPIWWDVAPRIINTFLESYDFSGASIIPFATSGGSTLEKALPSLRRSAKGANIHDGSMLNNASKASIAAWLNDLNLTYLPSNTKFETMTDEEKKKELFRRQKETLDTFLENGAISKEDYEKSLSYLKEKMGMN